LLEFTVSVADLDTPPALAVMTEELLPAVVPARIVNVALVSPSATVTLSGTVAAVVLPLVSATTNPPAGAGAVRVTVPVLVEPSTTAVGLMLRAESEGLVVPVVTVSTDDLETPPPVAVIVAEVLLVTAPVVIVNAALVAPPVTLTLGGTAATEELLLANVTVCPPEGAAEVKVTVPVAEEPPTTEVGLRLRLESEGVVEVTVQPDRRAVAAVADPSLTSTVQSAGAVKPLLSILNLPPPSLVPMATPSTVIVLLARAWPSIRRFVPLSSAREMLTAACAVEVTTRTPIRTRTPTTANTLLNGRKACGERSLVSIPLLPKPRWHVLSPSWVSLTLQSTTQM
jgi:hypothetical protein